MVSRIPADAFEFYVSLGEQRSYERVAGHFGVSKRAIVGCASRERWSRRLEKIEDEARRRLDQKLAETLEQIRERHLKTLRVVHARALTAIKEHPLSSGMEGVRAAELAIKLERLVIGEASERTEMSVEEVTRKEIASWLTRGGRDA